MRTTKSIAFAAGLALAASLAFAPAANATDGVILITQATAATGLPGCPNDGQSLITICAPGSYRLAGNLVAPNGINGIDINAHNVVLDLNGFVIEAVGAPPSLPPFSCGIYIDTSVDAVIRNGTVTRFDVGIFYNYDSYSNASTAEQVIVESVNAINNLEDGIFLEAGRVLDSVANGNGEGIFLNTGAIIRTTANNNLTVGITLGVGSNNAEGTGTIQDSTVEHNAGTDQIDLLGGYFSITGSTIGGSGDIGIEGGSAFIYRNDIFFDNGEDVVRGISGGGNICSNGAAC